MPEKWVYFFGGGQAEGDPERKDILGGKGASLAAMSRAGLPVPPGFTISAECCRLFFEADRRWPEGLEEQVRRALARLEEITGRKFGRGDRPLLVSVRSGAAISMPGMMDTILNCGVNPDLAEEVPDRDRFWRVYAQFVQMFARTVADISPSVFPTGDPPEASAKQYIRIYEERTGRPFPTDPWQALRECIDAVFNSWNNERAVTYRKAHDIRGLAGTAVNVQSMFPSEVSGILFTTNPNAIEAGEMIVEASFGLGEAVVSGDVTPDRFVLDRRTLKVKERTLGRKIHVVAALGAGTAEEPRPEDWTLSDRQLRELGEMALRVEEYFGHPVDLEWGLAEGRFGLLQARAIRGLEVAEDVEEGRREEIERLRALARGKRRVWVVHNLAETLRAPTPLTWDVIRHFMSGDGGFGRMYQYLGYRPGAEVRREGFLELICGRIYADPERAAGLFFDAMPLAYKVEEVRENPALLETAPTTFDPERADARFLLRLPITIYCMLRAGRRIKRLRRRALERFTETVLPPYLDYVKAAREEDLSRLSTAEVIAEFHRRRRRVLDEFGPESLLPGFFGGMAYQFVTMARLARKDKVVYKTFDFKYGLRSILHWVIPFAGVNMRKNPLYTLLSYAFHICVLATPVFLLAHVVLWRASWGVSWWSLPDKVADIMTLVVIIASLFFIIRRLVRPEVRNVSYWSDFFLALLVMAPFVTGFAAHYQWFSYRGTLIAHIVSGALWLLLIPWTRLIHMMWFPFTRAYMGSEFGAVRHARDW